MKTSSKILLIILALINYAAAVFIILSHFLNLYHGMDIYMPPYILASDLLSIVITVITLAVGTSLLSIVAESTKYRLANRSDVIRLSSDDNGTAEITFDAVRAIVEKKCRSFRFVTECSCDVDSSDKGTVLYVKLRPSPDTILTSATEELRAEIIKTVKEQTGIDISSVRVLILPCRVHKK